MHALKPMAIKQLREWVIVTAILGFGLTVFANGKGSTASNKSCTDIVLANTHPQFHGQAVIWGGRTYTSERFYELPTDPNAFYIGPEGDRDEALAKTKTYVALMHGIGAYYSNPLAMFQNMQLYNKSLVDSRGNDSYVAKYLKRELPEYSATDIFAESLAIPGPTDFGVGADSFLTLESLVDYFADHLIDVRSRLPKDAQIVVQGRSFSGPLAAEINYRYPGLIDKIILASPTYPNYDSIIAAVTKLFKDAETHGYRLDGDWINWAINHMVAMKWVHDQEDPFKGAEVLILQGQFDLERTDQETNFYGSLGLRFDNVSYLMVLGAGHDVTSIKGNTNSEKRNRADVFKTIYPFIAR